MQDDLKAGMEIHDISIFSQVTSLQGIELT